jgi:type VI secretion system protein ImpK
MSTRIKNPLLEKLSKFFSILIQFQQAEYRNNWKVESLQEKLSESLKNLEDTVGEQHGITSHDIKTAKYAVMALFDEVVMTSSWTERHHWMAKSLQWTYFGEHNAGEQFFKKIQELREFSHDKIDVLEIYYLCLQFGFKGIYRVAHQESLKILMSELQKIIIRQRDIADFSLTPITINTQHDNKAMLKIRYLKWLKLSFGGMFIIYLCFSIAIHHVAHSTVNQIQKINSPYSMLGDHS